VDEALNHCRTEKVDVDSFRQFLKEAFGSGDGGARASSAACAAVVSASRKTAGTRVYCRWPENDKFYWGTIVKSFFKLGRKTPLFTVSSKCFGNSDKEYCILFLIFDFPVD
jgi:hypothetical protein